MQEIKIKYEYLKFFILFFPLCAIIRLLYIIFFSKSIIEQYAQTQYEVHEKFIYPRGKIYDKNNILVAGNRETYSLYVVPSLLFNQDTLLFIEKNFPECYKFIQQHSQSQFAYLKRKISEEEKNIITKNYPDIYFFSEFERVYPYQFLSPIIGIVDIDNKGIAGIEMMLDALIEQKQYNYNIHKYALYENYSFIKENYENNSIQLSLDVSSCSIVTQLLKKIVNENNSLYASAIIMDANTGKIETISQYPFYDPKSNNDIYFLKSLPLCESYEKGSVFKSFCMLSALNNGIVEPDTLIDCESTKHTFIKKFRVNTWKAHGIIPYSQVVSESNNIGIAKVALEIGKNLYDDYYALGFGQKTGIEFPGESVGFITHPSKWSRQSILSLSYGYEVSATLIQLVKAWSCFCNNGGLVSPSLLLNSSTIQSNQKYSDTVIEKARSILLFKDEKIPKNLKNKLSQYKIFGKTGTANILEDGIYNKDKQTYTFVGNIENEDKTYNKIIGIYIRLSNKKNIYAASIATPLFFEIIEKVLLNKII